MRASEPVARMMFLVSSVWVPVSDFTSTCRAVARARQDRAVALDPVDLVLLHQELDALGVLGDDLVLAIEHHGVIQPRILAVDAVFAGVQEVLPDIGRVQQRFGRDAADMQAGAAQLGVFFDDGGLQAVLPGANRRRVAAGAAPDDNHVVCHFIFRITFEARRTSARQRECQVNWMPGKRVGFIPNAWPLASVARVRE